eukprot:XP_017453963.1 PREDICTED: rho GTPase-activating protein 20-like isoform X1 [Rattus norvegicus]
MKNACLLYHPCFLEPWTHDLLIRHMAGKSLTKIRMSQDSSQRHSIPDEGTLAGKINSIQSLLQQIPEPNFILLKHLICVLVIIKDSSMNNLDSYRLSLRIAPHVLWGQTSRDSLFGSDVLRKMSLIQIMIDNYHRIFGNDDIFSKHIDKRSEDLKTYKESINYSGKSPIVTKAIAWPQLENQ